MNNKILTQWSRMGPRAMFGQFMIDIAKKNKDLMVISADLGRSSGLDRYKAAFPDQYLSVGIWLINSKHAISIILSPFFGSKPVVSISTTISLILNTRLLI